MPPAENVQQDEVQQEEPREVATSFLPLSYAPPLEAESHHIVRMEVPRETLSALGVAIEEPRANATVNADVLYGEDGTAHAIRFVTTAPASAKASARQAPASAKASARPVRPATSERRPR